MARIGVRLIDWQWWCGQGGGDPLKHYLSIILTCLLSLFYPSLPHPTSRYQIYNVDKRIQEDNLQHLALFSEYGRMALAQKDPVQV